MSKLWLKNGKLLVDSSGRPIECDDCPCEETGCNACPPGQSFHRQLQLTASGFGPGDGIVNDPAYEALNGIHLLEFAPDYTPWIDGGPCIWLSEGVEITSYYCVSFQYTMQPSGMVFIRLKLQFDNSGPPCEQEDRDWWFNYALWTSDAAIGCEPADSDVFNTTSNVELVVEAI